MKFLISNLKNIFNYIPQYFLQYIFFSDEQSIKFIIRNIFPREHKIESEDQILKLLKSIP